MEKQGNMYKCFYCEKIYSTAEEALYCQEKHERIIRQSNTDSVNHYIKEAMLDTLNISDGRNTFGELYAEKNYLILALFALLAKDKSYDLWYTDLYSDGSLRAGFFLAGINKEPDLQITYILPVKHRDLLSKIATSLPTAPPFKAHTSKDVLGRLKKQIIEPTIEELKGEKNK